MGPEHLRIRVRVRVGLGLGLGLGLRLGLGHVWPLPDKYVKQHISEAYSIKLIQLQAINGCNEQQAKGTRETQHRHERRTGKHYFKMLSTPH